MYQVGTLTSCVPLVAGSYMGRVLGWYFTCWYGTATCTLQDYGQQKNQMQQRTCSTSQSNHQRALQPIHRPVWVCLAHWPTSRPTLADHILLNLLTCTPELTVRMSSCVKESQCQGNCARCVGATHTCKPTLAKGGCALQWRCAVQADGHCKMQSSMRYVILCRKHIRGTGPAAPR